MEVHLINKNGIVFKFSSCKQAKLHIKKENYKNYTIIKNKGRKIRIYDDRELI